MGKRILSRMQNLREEEMGQIECYSVCPRLVAVRRYQSRRGGTIAGKVLLLSQMRNQRKAKKELKGWGRRTWEQQIGTDVYLSDSYLLNCVLKY